MHSKNKKTLLKFVITAINLSLVACSSAGKQESLDSKDKPELASERPVDKVLTEAEAVFRAQVVSDVEYELSFDITSPDKLTGLALIRFEWKKPERALTIDFEGGLISELKINGAQEKLNYNGHFLTLSSESLIRGRNEVWIKFEHPYSNTGSGFYRFKDPEDGRVYLYTDFEPYEANELFPCFDQPDLKARYKLEALAPSEWLVVSATLEEKIKAEGPSRRWIFPWTEKFSTYVFSLHAGPYAKWEGKAGKNGRIPLRLFARRSLQKYVAHQEWLDITQKGFAFYEDYFAMPYPYGKYDQLIVPDFNAGAMENVGAVTFAERTVPRGKPTYKDRERRADVILHEMAHMWFGDLVTMRWWNDLWLNESFATYMSSLALMNVTEFKTAWQSFFSGTKQWAYLEDQWVTTHAIETPVPDTAQAFANFDGISYGKGASALKQVAFLLGPEKFRDGVRLYFKKHAGTNTERKDFVEALAQASGMDLSSWTNEWLKSKGVNTVQALYSCSLGQIQGFRLIQSAEEPGDDLLRTHRTVLGFFQRSDDGSVALAETLPVLYSGAETVVPAADGLACPAFVYANINDQDFVKIKLDGASVETIKSSLSGMRDAFHRTMMWQSLWDMVRDGELSLDAYVSLAKTNLPGESDFVTAKMVTDNLYGRWVGASSVLMYYPRHDEAEKMAYTKLVTDLGEFFWSQFIQAKPGSDFQRLWFDSFVRTSQSKEALVRLKQLLAGKKFKINGFEFDQNRRWDALVALSAQADPEVHALIEAEQKRDPSNYGLKMRVAAEAASPDINVKRRWFNEITNLESKESLATLKQAMKNLFPVSQQEMRSEFSQDFFDYWKGPAVRKESEFLEEFAGNLAPTLCEEVSTHALKYFITNDKNALDPVAYTELLKAQQEDERCSKIRASARGKRFGG